MDRQTRKFCSAVVENLPELPPDEMQYWIDRPNPLKNVLRQSLCSPHEIGSTAPRFPLLSTFEVVVPADYNHASCLALFQQAHEHELAYFNPYLTDQNFAKVSTKLTPGQRFEVKVYGIKGVVTSEDCLTHLRQNKATLVGAQGLALVYKQAKHKLPVNRWTLSFDKKDNLWQDADGNHRVPYVVRYSDGDFRFNLGSFEGVWYGYYVLLCFRDLTKSLDT